MPNQSPKMIKERILNFSIAHPGLGPKRGGIVVSPNGVWKVLCRHGLNTRIKRLAPSPATRLPMRESRDPGPERHSTSPGRASWSESTASSSGAYGGLRARSGSSPRSISPPPTPGLSWWSAKTGKPANQTPNRPPSSPAGSPRTRGRRAGAWSVSSPTTATSSRDSPARRRGPVRWRPLLAVYLDLWVGPMRPVTSLRGS
jgi:hypothetical protein